VTAWLVVRALTRDTERIGEIAHRVQSGDLSARVASRSNIPELRQLADDVDGMIARLAALVVSQERFIAHAAHELRSPLTTLYGELSLALRKQRTAEEYREFIDEALASSRRLKALAEDLLALARIGADATGDILLLPVTVRALVANVLNDLRASFATKGISVEVALPDASIIARERDLERLFRNLLENALRHTPDGGTIRIGGELRGETVFVTVEDSGEGVPETERERIFEPFYRGAKTRGEEMTGTGLGLAIVREIARVHGGEVSVTAARPFANSPVAGACFQVSLPAAER
jgi:two-component system heavy metal sensor histidine kinase CusS